ncbi:MAG: hypothetical protein GYA20_00575 [Chloroflexi bacterium]|nr:hypothetical protein [Chloroflexota bacterium]
MRTRLLWVFLLTILLAAVLTGAAGAALATLGPYRPGQAMFAVQYSAEHAYLDLRPGSQRRAAFGLTLLERRIGALETVNGTAAEIDVLTAVNTEIEHELALLQSVPAADEAPLRAGLVRDLEGLLAALDRLAYTPSASPQGFIGFRNAILALSLLARDASIPLANLYDLARNAGATAAGQATAAPGQPTPTPQTAIDPRMVLFPPGSPGAVHAFYPLTGAHALLQCQNCHAQGVYAGTPNLCSTCHAAARPTGHYSGECALCHGPDAWLPADFNHQALGATNCQSCHANIKPANHYAGQCSACHSTSAWRPATFNHAAVNASDCQSCHANKKPANHYNGQCSACHSTAAWRPATFNHAAVNAVDCQSCNANKKPANHFNGQCSACHATSAWRPANFNHQAAGAVDCVSCHSASKPANHYNGQCSACHSTSAWRPASFNHAAAGATDCQSCHARPANHFSGQCSQCHATTGWLPANFSHTFPLNHGGANGTCATCHPGGGSAYTCFNCHNEGELTQKHNEEGIPDYVSRCMECHADGQKHDD